MNLHIIVTCADLDTHVLSEDRRKEYIKTFEWLKNNAGNYSISWVECLKYENSFMEKYTPIHYTKVHNPEYRNKGSDWGQSIKKFLKETTIQFEYIMHLTGRYHFIDTHFFDSIQKNYGFDLYVKQSFDDQYKTGCFCMKTKKFYEWIYETDWDFLNHQMINVEKSIWDFSKQNNLKVCEFETLNMEWNIFGTGQPHRNFI